MSLLASGTKTFTLNLKGVLVLPVIVLSTVVIVSVSSLPVNILLLRDIFYRNLILK